MQLNISVSQTFANICIYFKCFTILWVNLLFELYIILSWISLFLSMFLHPCSRILMRLLSIYLWRRQFVRSWNFQRIYSLNQQPHQKALRWNPDFVDLKQTLFWRQHLLAVTFWRFHYLLDLDLSLWLAHISVTLGGERD